MMAEFLRDLSSKKEIEESKEFVNQIKEVLQDSMTNILELGMV